MVMRRQLKIYLLVLIVRMLTPGGVAAHEISFCGEKIPVSNSFVSNKLMDVIRRQIPNINLPQLRKRAKENFPSGFLNGQSVAGARGFWQLMPATAKEKGLIVSDDLDERDDIDKSTRAACYILGEYYQSIQKKFGVSSWVLAAAAYNVGIGKIHRTMKSQGEDYFSMNLNAETAVYVYKIIAVKELFEYPEFYLRDFGYNIFNSQSAVSYSSPASQQQDVAFTSVEVQVSGRKDHGTEPSKEVYRFIAAKIKGAYEGITDRSLISIELQEKFELKGNYRAKGTILKGTGWLIDGKVFIDLGYDHDVIVYDKNGNGGKAGEQGIELSVLKDKEPVLLKVRDYNF
jgi:membrane-bound lytic murein transglycosylase D